MIVAASLTLLAGCPVETIPPVASGSVDQLDILQSYAVTYSEWEGRTRVSAWFREGEAGPVLQLTPPSKVVHNVLTLGEYLWTWPDSGAEYFDSTDGYVEDHRWTWTDTEGREYVNEFSFAPTFAYEAPSEVSRSQGATIAFLPPLLAGETVFVQLEGDVGHWATFGTSEPQATTVVLDPERLSELAEGNIQIYVNRVGDYALQEATPAGGQIHAEYVAHPRPAELVP